MTKLLLYKILLIANTTISILLIAFIIVFRPNGYTLFLTMLMTLVGLLGAVSMYREIRKNKKLN